MLICIISTATNPMWHRYSCLVCCFVSLFSGVIQKIYYFLCSQVINNFFSRLAQTRGYKSKAKNQNQNLKLKKKIQKTAAHSN